MDRLTQIDAKSYSKMNLFFIILLLCDKISGNAISLQNEQILSREERFLDAILGATNNAGELSYRLYNLLNDRCLVVENKTH